MFSYKSQPIGAELLQKNHEEEEDVVQLLKSKEINSEEEAEKEKMDREVRKMQDMDINAQK